LIEADAINVLVPYDPEAFENLKRRLESDGHLSAPWIRDARAHTVSLYRPDRGAPILSALDPAPLGRDGEESREWFVLQAEDLYDRTRLGLLADEPVLIA